MVASVTGATSGIGRAFATRFAREGYDLIISGRRMEILNGLALQLREQYLVEVRVVVAELSEDEGIQKIKDIIEAQDNIYILVNNAGFGSKDQEISRSDRAFSIM